jgi:hypothetical protein
MRCLPSVWIAALVLLTSRTGLAQEQFRDVDGDRGPRFFSRPHPDGSTFRWTWPGRRAFGSAFRSRSMA